MASPASNVDPDVAAAFDAASSSSSAGAQIDPDIADAFKANAPANNDETIQDFEARHDVLGQQPMDVSSLQHPWRSLGRMAAGAVTNLAGMIPFAGGGIADAIRKRTAAIQPQTIGEQIGAAGMDASLPLLTMGMGAKDKEPSLTPEQVLANQAASSQTNMGAAAAAPTLANASPELRAAIVAAAQKTGGAVNPDALQRHLEADALPVRMQLTEGQATQEPTILSQEFNSRGKNASLAQRYNDQNMQLGQNLQALRDEAGPDVFTTNPVEHADTLIGAYKAKAALADADTSAKYQALRDANGGQFPVDAGKLLQNATTDLHQQLLFDHAPKAVMSTLGRLADNDNMSFENFESLRTNLARIQRSSQDGNEVAAAGVIRNAMEQLPLEPGSARLKPLADTARDAARNQFQAVEADPAYKAALSDVAPDQFISKYVIRGNRDDVALMRKNLADNEPAIQTMSVAAIDHLRDQARIDPQGNGNFAAANYNKAFQALSPKLQSLVDPKTAGSLESIGNVARYVKGQPAGSFVNNSNTFTALAGEGAKSAVEGAINVAAKGVPVATWARKAMQARSVAAQTRQSLAPGAGLTKLSDLMRPPP